jgi:hypothetical protein
MKKIFLMLIVAAFALVLSAPATIAQGALKSGPDGATVRDAELEKDSAHNLEVAWHYFKLKKAYVAALKRCEEIIAGNPTFARMDKVLYVAAESSMMLAQNKGKQAVKDKTPEQLKEDARDYYSQLVLDYPQSEFMKEAQEKLNTLGGPREKSENKP